MSSRRDLANAIRALSMDAVQRAKSGHPGMPMGMADIAEVLWNDYLRHNPGNPRWCDRDRFVLSNGHGSMLLYSLLHLSGYALPMEEIVNFRQLHSMTPGHPEYGDTPGVETTTGPLGQGLANAVGMAIAEKVLATRFNRGDHVIVDHHTYVFVGDGCLMEGISHEACSLAGTLGLGKLIVIYDDNGISIDGEVKNWYTDDTPARFAAYGWHVVPDVDGHDAGAIASAIGAARDVADRPSLVCCKTIIGWGSPNKQGKESSHGAALGEDEVQLVRETIGWSHAPFKVPDDIAAAWNASSRGQALEDAWIERFEAYRSDHPDLAAEFTRRMEGAMPDGWGEHADAFIAEVQQAGENIASRKASQNALEGLAPMLPELIGGSADLTGSNLTLHSGSRPVSATSEDGNYIYFGVREFAMSAILNGLALHGGFIPYGATFLTFSEYARNALRMAALMGIRSVFVYTHDSIGLGEDGPTHQAVEQVATLRLMPNMSVWRPCDAAESAIAWRHAIGRTEGPTSLLFSRQGLPHQPRTGEQLADTARGGYVLRDCADTPQALIIATGSEVALAVEASTILEQRGVAVRVVSMPSTDVFDAESSAYRESVLPPSVKARVSVEAGVTDYWFKYIGDYGRTVGVDTFGLSAPFEKVYEHFGLTAESVVRAVEESIADVGAAAAGVAAE
jgi:transketolase